MGSYVFAILLTICLLIAKPPGFNPALEFKDALFLLSAPCALPLVTLLALGALFDTIWAAIFVSAYALIWVMAYRLLLRRHPPREISPLSRDACFRILRLVAFAGGVFGVISFVVVRMFPLPESVRAVQQAEKLEGIVRRQPQLSEVRIRANGSRFIAFIPVGFPQAAKTELERILAERANDYPTTVSYNEQPVPIIPDTKNPN